MAKVDKQKLAEYKKHDRAAMDFANNAITKFFERAMAEGFSLDTTGFLQHPGFFQAPYRRDDLEGVDIAIVGCPLDLGAIGLAGSRHGPKAIREATRNCGPIHDVTGKIPFEQCSIVEFGDVEWTCASLETRVSENIADTFYDIASKGIATMSCGGEHTTTYGVLKGLSRAHDDSFGMIHIDAHCDTMAAWDGDIINIGSVFRQAVLDGYLDPERVVQIGIRGRSDFLWEFSHDVGMTVISADEVFEKGMPYVIDKAREIVGTEKTYFSLDVDGLDSAYMMGTTGPEPFGLTHRQVRDLILAVHDLNIIGADIVEMNPLRDPNGYSAHLAAALFWELLCLVADARVAHSEKTSNTSWA